MPLPPQFGNVFQLMPTPSILFLPDAPKFTIVAVNNAYLEVMNLSEKDLIGKGIFDTFPENPANTESTGVKNLRSSLEDVISKKESHKMSIQKYNIPLHRTSKFRVNYGSIQNIPIKDKENNITHILHSIEELTDKKNFEIRFDTERQRFNDLYWQAPSCMVILKGPDHVYEMANNSYLQLINKKNIIGKSFKKIRPETAEQGIIEILDQVYRTGKTFSANEMLIKLDKEANGEIVDFYHDLLIQPHKGQNGKIDGVFFFFIDVTEKVESRKKIEESEKRYRELIQNLPVAAYSCDAEGHILVYNKAAATLWGREPKIGKDKWSGSWKVYNKNGNPLPQDMCPIAIALTEGRAITDQEILVERPNGDKLNIVPHPVPFMDSSGRITGAVNMLIDITESKKAEENIKKQNLELIIQYQEKKDQAAELFMTNKELLKTNTELDRFVYSVSHDLRSPLTSILGLIFFIEEDSREPDTLEQVKMIRDSINRLDRFIKNILSYSQNNRTGLETKKIHIKKTINEIVDSVRNITEAKGISFEIDIDEQKPFYSDWQRFNTILENLIFNAIKYHTEEVSGRYLKVSGTTNNEELRLSISDNGIGIDAPYHGKIFDMFYRLSGKTPGSGFGLYIVKETLEKMHGKIEVQSEIGVGTTFIITLKNLKE
jgi:PAS domain S-box-containing protein